MNEVLVCWARAEDCSLGGVGGDGGEGGRSSGGERVG